jgi:hypothetical protein
MNVPHQLETGEFSFKITNLNKLRKHQDITEKPFRILSQKFNKEIKIWKIHTGILELETTVNELKNAEERLE